MKVVGVIPARYSSSRFPGKPLADICGKPMIWWVYNQAKKVDELNEVYVATDDSRIENVCKHYNMNVIMTSDNIKTSTERLHYVSKIITADVYICINGDEPLIDPSIIEKIIPSNLDEFYVSNLMSIIKSPVDLIDNTNIKVVTDYKYFALFMSRNPIPYPKASLNIDYYKHLGVLAYSLGALEFFANTQKGKNELVEDINELRFIENGKKLKMIVVESDSLSVDTPKDLDKVRSIIQKKLIVEKL